MMLPPFIAQLPRLSLSSSVILIRNIDVLPQRPMFCPLLFSAWSRVAICLEAVHVPQGCVWIAELILLAVVCSCCPLFGIGAMDTRSFADLRKAIESLEAGKKAMAEKMKAMVRSKGLGQWYSNDIKVEIPEYDGKLDPDEFLEWLRICDLPEDEPQTLVRYLRGLETRVANIVELYPNSSLDDLTLLADVL
ncbi:hypothetical protein Tco_1281433 [Tanacetum coccineum]